MPQAPTPELVIYLQASAEKLIERFTKRGIAYERHYFRALSGPAGRAYSRFFYQFSAAPLLIVTARLEFC